MLNVTFDLYSGLSNPSYILLDDAEVRAVVREIEADQAITTSGPGPEAPLGFRGLSIEPLEDDEAQQATLPHATYVPVGANADAGSALVERLIALSDRADVMQPANVGELARDVPLREVLTQQLRGTPGGRTTETDSPPTGTSEAEAAGAPTDAAVASCLIERAPYNPGFWNDDATVRSSNNCYNYASNKRTNTFAQPGRGCGQMYTAITCPEVTRGALCDGLHHRYHCFPDSDSPRYVVALVVAPGPAFRDFHWYRWLREGFWAHKPGGTAVRNVDNSGRLITDPQACDRGPYTHFCGYFYTRRTQLIR
jgi:hypothetical protein